MHILLSSLVSLTKALHTLPISWDEWVGMDRLMKYSEENIVKQQTLDKKAGVDKSTKSGRSAQAKPKSSAGMPLCLWSDK